MNRPITYSHMVSDKGDKAICKGLQGWEAGWRGEGWKVGPRAVHRLDCEELCNTGIQKWGKAEQQGEERNKASMQRSEKKRGEEGHEIKQLDSSDTRWAVRSQTGQSKWHENHREPGSGMDGKGHWIFMLPATKVHQVLRSMAGCTLTLRLFSVRFHQGALHPSLSLTAQLPEEAPPSPFTRSLTPRFYFCPLISSNTAFTKVTGPPSDKHSADFLALILPSLFFLNSYHTLNFPSLMHPHLLF